MKARQGDTASLHQRHATKVKVVALSILGDADEADDAVGDVFADVATGKISIEGNKTEAMLFTCLRNRCLNNLKRKSLLQRIKGKMQLDNHVDISPPERKVDRLEEILDFIDTKLTPQTARIVRMHYQKKMKYHEIAAELGISEAAVYKHLAQGITKLREKFNEN